MFASPKRSELNDVALKVVQSSCTVTSIAKTKSTTAFLSVSTASLKPISVIQQQMQAIMEHFAALDLYGFLSPTYKVCRGQARYLFLGLMGPEMRSIYLHMKPKTLGFEPNFTRSSSPMMMAGNGNRDHECCIWLHYVLQIFFSVSNAFRLHVWFRHHL